MAVPLCRAWHAKCKSFSNSLVYGSEINSYTSKRIMSSRMADSSVYCMDLVRKHDYENYLCTLLLPTNTRYAAMIIRAFNVELAQVRDQISDSTIGLMRMRFWKDTVEKVFSGHPPQQPVAIELAKVLRKMKLSKIWFRRLIESRESNLNDRAFTNVGEVETYMENSTSSIHYLILESLGVKNLEVDHAASHMGKAQGFVTLIRAIPFNASKGRVYIPRDLMLKYSVSEERFLRGNGHEDLVYELASNAHRHLNTARSLRSQVPKEAHRVFLPLIPCETFLERLQRVNFDVFHSQLLRRDHVMPFKLAWATLKGPLRS